MKTGWQTSTLGDVLATMKNGLNCKQNKSGVGQKISRIESISLAAFDLSRVGYAEISDSDKSKFKLIRGDILFSHINSPIHVGKTAVFDEDEDVYHGVNLLLMRPVEAVKSAYLEFFLKYLFDTGYWRKTCKQSVNQASVNQQDISRVPFSFPTDQKEQQRIVTLLNEAFDGIATAKTNAEMNLQNAWTIFESHLKAVFDKHVELYRCIQLEEMTEQESPITYGVVKPGDEGTVAFVRGGDLVRGAVRLTQLRTITQAISDQYKRTILRGGELLICLVGQPGQVGVAPSDLAGANIARQVGLIRLSENSNPEYVKLFLQSPTGQHALYAKQSGSVQQVINLSELRQIKVPVPSLQVQELTVNRVNEFLVESVRLESIYQKKLTALDELKKSLLYRAFNGDL